MLESIKLVKSSTVEKRQRKSESQASTSSDVTISDTYSASETVHMLQNLITHSAAPFDAVKVAQFQALLDSGQYEVDVDKLAHAIIELNR